MQHKQLLFFTLCVCVCTMNEIPTRVSMKTLSKMCIVHQGNQGLNEFFFEIVLQIERLMHKN